MPYLMWDLNLSLFAHRLAAVSFNLLNSQTPTVDPRRVGGQRDRKVIGITASPGLFPSREDK
jgi:hypothetical protein